MAYLDIILAVHVLIADTDHITQLLQLRNVKNGLRQQ